MEIIEYDLLEIGDNVVFGSRSAFFTSTSQEAKRIVIEDGAMIADRYVFVLCLLLLLLLPCLIS